MAPVLTIGQAADPDQRIRDSWAESIAEHMACIGLTRKGLRQRLIDEHGIEVSTQTIGGWLNGAWAPRPHVQIAIAAIFNVPARRLFPLESA